MAQHSTDPSTDSMKKSSSCFSEKQGSSSSSHEPNTITTTTTTTVASDLSAISMPHAMETSTHISAHPSSVSASLSVLCSDPDPDVPQQNPSTHHHHHHPCQITMASSPHVPAAAHNLYGPVFPVAAPHNHHHLHHHHHHHHHALHSDVSSSNTDSASPSQQHRSRHHRFLSASSSSSSSSSSAPSTTMSSHQCSCHASTAALSWLSSTSAEIVEIENIPALSLVAEPELDALHPSTNRSSNRFGEDEGKNPQGMVVARQRSCEACRKRVGLVGGFKCKCGGLFCGVHRYSDRHNCSFDYKAAGREAIAKENPRVEAIKLVKI